MNTDATVSKIYRSDNLKAIDRSVYDSLGLLYKETKPDVFGDHIGLILACNKDIHFPEGCDACLHKLEIVASPNFADAHMQITHEVLPGLGKSTEILNVNDDLIAASFESGSIMEIKNFGYKKTFNSDVKGSLKNHGQLINCMNIDSTSHQLASGTTNGEIGLYSVNKEKISFISRANVASDYITGLSYLQSSDEICFKPSDAKVDDGENILVFSTSTGQIGFVDTRCNLGSEFKYKRATKIDQEKYNISTLCSIPELPGHQIFFGTVHGQLMGIDLRYLSDFIFKQDLPEDKCIRRIRKIVIYENGSKRRVFLAYINSTNEIKIYDIYTKRPDKKWTCDRNPGARQRDLKQIGNRIVTCGDDSSIGCWVWDSPIRAHQNEVEK